MSLERWHAIDTDVNGRTCPVAEYRLQPGLTPEQALAAVRRIRAAQGHPQPYTSVREVRKA